MMLKNYSGENGVNELKEVGNDTCLHIGDDIINLQGIRAPEKRDSEFITQPWLLCPLEDLLQLRQRNDMRDRPAVRAAGGKVGFVHAAQQFGDLACFQLVNAAYN